MYLKQGDLSPALTGDLNADVTGATVVAVLRKQHGTTVLTRTCTITDGPTGIVTYQWVAGDTDIAGTYSVEFKVTYAGGAIQRFPQRSYRELTIKPKVG